MDTRAGDRHRGPRLAPLSLDQDDFDKIKTIADRLNLPMAWVARKLITEGLEEVNIDNLPTNIFRR